MNMKGVKVEQLETTEVSTTVKKEVEPQFVDVVGQISLRALERNSQKRKQRARDQRDREKPGDRDGQPRQQQRDGKGQRDNRDNRDKSGGNRGNRGTGGGGGKREIGPPKKKNP
jgi:hypothetical protein